METMTTIKAELMKSSEIAIISMQQTTDNRQAAHVTHDT